MECPSITIHSPDWSEHATYLEPGYYRSPCRIGFNTTGHNWYGVARIDVEFRPTDVPFIYSGKIYTGGLSSHTCKLTRLKSRHQLTNHIPAHAVFTPLGDGITRAEWTTIRHCRHGWLDRRRRHTLYVTRASHGWIYAETPEQAIAQAMLQRLQIPIAA
jgi:hypothetical protein